jgi:DNA/RNA-binding domain of Phe-tRNA-synthetase-like protein/ribosomal protein S18 acetylase RimI-like enzyme
MELEAKNNVLIEQAAVQDAAEILTLQKLAYQSEAAIYGDYTIPPLTQSLDSMVTQFQHDMVLKAVLDGKIVGSVRGYLQDGTCYIGRLIVHPDFQNRGLGTRLMREIEARFGQAERCELFTGENSLKDLHIYHKLGYQPVRREQLTERVRLVYLEKWRQSFEVSDAWKSAFETAYAGVLIMRGVTNPARHAALEQRKAALEEQLRSRYLGQDRTAIGSHPILQAYAAYYRRFKKTYHVQLQLESIALKGKSIPSVATLVEAMFMAEVKNMLLTAGHDLDAVQLPITVDVSRGDERYTLLRGHEHVLKAGDMMMVDRSGVISSVVYGPDQRTQIRASTRNVAFFVYAPPGIEQAAVEQHLEDIQQNVMLVAPQARVETLKVLGGR